MSSATVAPTSLYASGVGNSARFDFATARMRLASSDGSSAASRTLRAAPEKPMLPEIRRSGSLPSPLFVWVATTTATPVFSARSANGASTRQDMMIAVRVDAVTDECDERIERHESNVEVADELAQELDTLGEVDRHGDYMHELEVCISRLVWSHHRREVIFSGDDQHGLAFA